MPTPAAVAAASWTPSTARPATNPFPVMCPRESQPKSNSPPMTELVSAAQPLAGSSDAVSNRPGRSCGTPGESRGGAAPDRGLGQLRRLHPGLPAALRTARAARSLDAAYWWVPGDGRHPRILCRGSDGAGGESGDGEAS